MKLFISILLFCLLVSSGCKLRQTSTLKDGSSRQNQDFPNYFERVSQQAFNQALVSIAKRLMLPVYDLNSDNAQLEPFMTSVNNKIKQIHGTEYEMMPSYGVTRTIVGYLYSQIHRQKLRHPEKKVAQILEFIVNSREPIPALQVRGIGSDLDFAIRRKDGKSVDDKVLSEIKNNIVKMLLEPSLRTGATAGKDTDRTFFVSPDVKDHITQVGWTKKQGGSEVDMIALSLDEGRVVEPDLGDHTVRDLLSGIYRYVSGEKQEKDGRQKQTIRGLRPLVELPWLSLDSKSETLLLSEINQLNSELKQDGQISSKADEQLEKLTRNSWFSGANNRLWGDEPIARTVRQFNQFYKEKKSKFGIPIFAPHRSINQTPSKTDMPAELFTPIEDFIRSKTDNGKLYHGTSNAGLAIMREGLFLSGKGQGNYVYGPGAYTTSSESTASGYKNSNGWLFKLIVRNSPKIKIFDFEKHQNQPWVREQVAKLGGRDPFFDTLREEYGIDIIVNEHVLVQNAAVLDYPSSLRELYQATDLTSTFADPVKSLKRLDYLTIIFKYLTIAGESTSGLVRPNQVINNIILNLKNGAYTEAKKYELLNESVRSKSTASLIIPLFAAGTDLNIKDRDSWTPLHWASERANLDAIKALITAGADPDIKDNRGRAPLHWAIKRGNSNVAETLIFAGADPGIKDNTGKTPLHWAAEFNQLNAINALTAAGVNLDVKDNSGNTPLHWAVTSSKKLDSINALIAAGADLNIQDKAGQTPLFWAAKGNKLDTIKALVTAGANANIKDNKGSTPLQWATSPSRNNLDAVKVLIASGADPNVVNIQTVRNLEIKDELVRAKEQYQSPSQQNNLRAPAGACEKLGDAL